MRNSRWKKCLAGLLAGLLGLCLVGCGGQPDLNGKDLEKTLAKSCAYTMDAVGVMDAEEESTAWLIFGCEKAGQGALTVEDRADYLDSVRGLVKSRKGVLSRDKYTTYMRISMAVKAVGADPAEVEGYDLMQPVDQYDPVCEQGINAEIYALISSSYVGYELKNRERYLRDILQAQIEDGSIAFDEKDGDLDITAMAVQALAIYKDRAPVQETIDKARAFLSRNQKKDGSYGNCESTAQVILAVGALGEDPTKAKDFVKEGNTLADGLALYWTGKAFCHKKGEEEDIMATQQAILAMDGILAGRKGKSLFQ